MHLVEKIRAEYPAPFYIYDGKVISKQPSILHKTFPGFCFLFSVKANPFLPVLKKISSLGLDADAASVKRSGFGRHTCGKYLLFLPGPHQKRYRQVIGKCHIIADSFHIFFLLEEAAAERNLKLTAGLRIHPDFTMDGTPQMPSKFGIDENHVWKVSFAEKYPHLTINGLHVHIRSANLLRESGRFLACDCGTYVTEIIDIKRSHGKTF